MTLTQITEKGIKDGEIINADINANAAIAKSKLASLDIVNGDINASAAIAGSKISPDFGSQGITTTGDITAGDITASGGDLTVSGTTAVIHLTDTNNDDDFSIMNENGNFRIRDATHSLNRLNIDSSGTVDVTGNLNALGGLDVTGDITSTGNYTITNSQPKIFLTDNNSDSDYSIQNENGNLNFYDETNTTSRIRIISTGKVGINHTSPSSRVEIAETHDATGAGTHTKVLKLSTTSYGVGEGPKIEFGTTNSTYSAWIYGDICSEYEGGAFGGAILFRTNSGSGATSVSERLRIKRDGNVRINNGDLQLYGTDNGVVGLGVDSATYGKVNIKVAGSDGSGSNNVATFSRESGSSAIELHFPAGGGINFNSTVDGSSVSGVTATSELLDDYEEGTFQPILKRLMTNGTTETNFYTQGTRQGNYTRIGDRVWISARIHWGNGGSTGSGSLIIANLPFSVADNGANEVPLVVGYRDGINYSNVTGYAAPGMNRFYVTTFDTSVTFAISPSATDDSGALYFSAHYEIG